MTTWQWKVILSLIRIVLASIRPNSRFRFYESDVLLLMEALTRGEDIENES